MAYHGEFFCFNIRAIGPVPVGHGQLPTGVASDSVTIWVPGRQGGWRSSGTWNRKDSRGHLGKGNMLLVSQYACARGFDHMKVDEG